MKFRFQVNGIIESQLVDIRANNVSDMIAGLIEDEKDTKITGISVFEIPEKEHHSGKGVARKKVV